MLLLSEENLHDLVGHNEANYTERTKYLLVLLSVGFSSCQQIEFQNDYLYRKSYSEQQ